MNKIPEWAEKADLEIEAAILKSGRRRYKKSALRVILRSFARGFGLSDRELNLLK